MVARAIAPFLEQKLGATIIVNNGTGSQVKVINETYKASPDGLNISMLDRGTMTLNYLTKEPGVAWDPDKFIWISVQGLQRNIVCVQANGPYKSMDDLQRAKGLKFTVTSPTGNYSLGAMVAIEAFKLDAKVITGLAVGEFRLSVQKGESDACVLTEAPLIEAVKGGQLTPILSIYTKTKLFPGVPSILDVPNLTEQQRLTAEMVGPTDKLLLLPPGTSQDKVDFLRGVLKKINEDPNNIEILKKRTGLADWVFVEGEVAQKEIVRQIKKSQEIKTYLDMLVKRYRL
jgi:tripartite-type tricarboxylate transporter receptor subunit TctC